MSATASRDSQTVVRQALAVGAITRESLDHDLLNLIKDQLCRPRFREATDAELAYFTGVCMRTQLDPFARQIFAIFRKDNQDGGKEKLTVQTSIDGFRLIAERAGKHEGSTDPLWCDDEGRWTDVWLSSNNPHAARVGVWKTGAREAMSGIAYWKMYGATATGPLWRSGGPHMLAKCAEALALRRAFPQELSGLYTTDEMAASAAVIDGTVVEEVPTPRPGAVTADPPARTESIASAAQRGLIMARATEAGLSGAEFANALASLGGKPARAWDDQDPIQFVQRQLDRLPARRVDDALAAVAGGGADAA